MERQNYGKFGRCNVKALAKKSIYTENAIAGDRIQAGILTTILQ